MSPRPAPLEGLLALLLGCAGCAVLPEDERALAYDADGDGWDFTRDCDGQDASVYPGADDLFGDDVDQNCDGSDGLDADGDGFASEASGGADCDDEEATVNPDANEICGDGLINNCASSAQESQSACVPSGELSLARADATVEGDQAGGNLGMAVAGVADIGGATPGRDDVILGAPYALNDEGVRAGRAYVLLGPLEGEVSVASAFATISGEEETQLLGSALTGGADVTGDGYADLVVGAPGTSSTSGARAGAAYLFVFPIEGNLDVSQADLSIRGAEPDEYAGESVLLIGDVESAADGNSDLLVGAPHASADDQPVGLVSLCTSAMVALQTASTRDCSLRLLGVSAGERAGSALGIGDLDGSGVPDLVVGAPFPRSSEPGAVYLMLDFAVDASGDLSLEDADLSFRGGRASDEAGASVSAAGDVDGDGHADLLVGAPLDQEEAGSAALILGGGGLGWVLRRSLNATLDRNDANILGSEPGQELGRSVVVLNDIDGDDHDELLVGAPGASLAADGAGAALMVMGPVSGQQSIDTADLVALGDQADDRAGWALCGPGDVDGNGFSDLLIGAPGLDGASEGRASVLLSGY